VTALPLGVFSVGGGSARVGAASGDFIVDLAADIDPEVFGNASLARFLELGLAYWRTTQERIRELLDSGTATLIDRASADLHLPVEIADFVDFFSSLEHATNAGRILRPDNQGLPAAWRHMPIGYHGRAGTVVVSGTPIQRPTGQVRTPEGIVFRPTAKLDVEVELGYIVGLPSTPGRPVPTAAFEEHVFGAVILLDWSARDIQALEYQPLGPFLGKSFATTISPWVVPLDALAGARVAAPERDPEPLPHLREETRWSLDIGFELRIDGRVVSRPEFASMYWTGAQQMAHLTSNGASLRTGDLYGSGTISSFDAAGQGSLLELTHDGTVLLDGRDTGYLADGDLVEVSAVARCHSGDIVDFGVANARIVPRP
jgi:fumarylacetoacetase